MQMKKVDFLIYIIGAVFILIVLTITGTYAYYKVSTTGSGSTVKATASMECVDMSLSSSTNLNLLSYNYPITDSIATTSGNITPVTVTVTNNCSASANYSIALTSMYSGTDSSYIADNQIRYKMLKNNAAHKGVGYLSSVTQAGTSSQIYRDLVTYNELGTRYPTYTRKNIYLIDDSVTLGASKSNTYAVYLWIDYYEGDSAAYSGSAHDTSYDNTTAGKKFAAAISLSLN